MTAIDPGSARTPGAAGRPDPWRLDHDGVRRVVYALLVLFWFTLPWEAVIRIGGTSTLARGIGAVLLLGGVVAVAVTGRRQRPDDMVALTGLLTAVVLASFWWTTTPTDTVARVATMVQLLVMVLLTWEFAHTRARVLGLMQAWLAGCLIASGLAGIGFLSGADQTRYTVSGSSPGDVAYSLLIGVPMAWYLSIRTTRPVMVWVYRLFVPLACLTVVLTASRAGLVTMVVALAVVPLTYRWLSGRDRVGLLVSLAALAAVAAALVPALSAPLSRLSTTSSELTSGTLDQRTTVWGIGLDLMRQHPLLGLGAGGSKNAVSGRFYTDRGLHNTFLSIGVELGLLGLTVFLLLAVVAGYRMLFRLAPLETRTSWVLGLVFLLSLSTRHADYEKSTYALLALFALMGRLLPQRHGPTGPD